VSRNYTGVALKVRRRLRERAWAAQKGCCYYCGFRMEFRPRGDFGATLDHKQPLSRGGTWDAENIVCACGLCNNVKGDMTESEFKALLTEIRDVRREVA
jgi:5-methylcytosine-specific restriction endonuclease McrA